MFIKYVLCTYLAATYPDVFYFAKSNARVKKFLFAVQIQIVI